MKKRLTGLMAIVLLLVVAVAAGCSAKTEPKSSGSGESKKEPILVGAVFESTGISSSLGVPEKNTVQMLEEQINAAGGINGRPLKVILYDNKSTEADSALAIKRLIEQDKVTAVIGAATSGPTMAMVPVAQEKQIPMVSSASSIKIIEPVAERKWVFKTAQRDSNIATKITEYLKKNNISTVALMSVNNPYGQSGVAEFTAAATKAGINVVSREKFEQADTDMTAQLTKIKQANPQALIVWAIPPAASNAAKSIKQVGLNVPLIFTDGIANKAFIDLAGEAANGIVFPIGRLLVAEALPDSDPQKAVVTKYAKDFETKFNTSRTPFGGYAYDALSLVVEALKKAGNNPTPAAVRDQLENIQKFNGVTGIYNFSPQDHNGLSVSDLLMVKIVNGKWTWLKD